MDALRLPEPAPPERTDNLWRHLCFEAFLQAEGQAGYVELNFAPTGAWAAYEFESYRQGMRALGIAPPRIEVISGPDGISLDAQAELPLPDHAVWRVGLSAVVEASDGSLSYWALREAEGDPDFHQGSCFAMQLPPPA